ncbi:MAG: hypothetical protein ACK42Y_06205 [Candidatus Thermochlorobacter sp.]
MSDTALVVFGTIITILLVGGIVFSLLEFKRMHDNPKPENMSDRPPATDSKPSRPVKVSKDEY